jgi:hypothetical protein
MSVVNSESNSSLTPVVSAGEDSRGNGGFDAPVRLSFLVSVMEATDLEAKVRVCVPCSSSSSSSSSSSVCAVCV